MINARFRTSLLLLLLIAAPALADVALEPTQAEVNRVHDMYRAITQYHVLLAGEEVSREMIGSTLFDVGRYVDELDNRYQTDKLFIKDQKALLEIRNTVAKAHFEAAVLHAKGVDLESSISEYEKVIDLLGFDPTEWDQQIERSAHRGKLANAVETAYETATPKEIVQDLREFWSAGVSTRFKVREYTMEQRRALRLERIGGPMDQFSQASYALAAERFSERIGSGIEEFRIVLPPGFYRVAAKLPGVSALEFTLAANSSPDPVVVNPNTFSLEFVSDDLKCRPSLTLNGLPVRELKSVSFGTYRLQPAPGCTRRVPDKITIDQNQSVTLRTEPERLDYAKEGQPIFVFVTTPPNSVYKLRF